MTTCLLLFLVAVEQLQPLLSFRREPSFRQPVAVDIGLLSSAGRSVYWLKKTEFERGKPIVWWSDTARCPAALAALHKLRDLPMPRVHVPLLDRDDLMMTADGTIYKLSGDADDRGGYKFSLSSNGGTPLAKWVDESLQAMSPCWSKKEPRR